MKSRPTLIQILRSNTFALIIAILSVIVQSFHSFTAFYKVSSLNGTAWGVAQAVLFAIIIDLAILFYTVRKNVKVTWMAGFIMVLINCYYYYSHLGLTFDLALGALLSLVIPVSVYFYSEEIDDEKDKEQVNKAIEEASGVVNKIIDLQKEMLKTSKPKYPTGTESNSGIAMVGEKGEEIILDEPLIDIKSAGKQIHDNSNIAEAIKFAKKMNRAGIDIGGVDESVIQVTPAPKGFASLKSESQQPPQDKSLVNIISTDRPNKDEA